MSTKLNSVDIVGSFFASSHGTDCVVTKYTNSQKVTVRFLDSYEYEGVFPIFALRKSKVPNPYDKTVCGVGCLGEGIYKAYNHQKDLHVKEVTKYWEGKVCKDVLESINNWRKRN